jgi:hypothetical protein
VTIELKYGFPVAQCGNPSVPLGFPVVPVLCCHEQRVFVLERDSVIQRVEQMVIDLNRKASCAADDVRVIGRDADGICWRSQIHCDAEI